MYVSNHDSTSMRRQCFNCQRRRLRRHAYRMDSITKPASSVSGSKPQQRYKMVDRNDTRWLPLPHMDFGTRDSIRIQENCLTANVVHRSSHSPDGGQASFLFRCHVSKKIRYCGSACAPSNMTLSLYCAPYLPPTPPFRFPYTTMLLHAEWYPWLDRRSPDDPVPTCRDASVAGLRYIYIDIYIYVCKNFYIAGATAKVGTAMRLHRIIALLVGHEVHKLQHYPFMKPHPVRSDARLQGSQQTGCAPCRGRRGTAALRVFRGLRQARRPIRQNDIKWEQPRLLQQKSDRCMHRRGCCSPRKHTTWSCSGEASWYERTHYRSCCCMHTSGTFISASSRSLLDRAASSFKAVRVQL